MGSSWDSNWSEPLLRISRAQNPSSLVSTQGNGRAQAEALLVLQSKFMEKSGQRNREQLCVCTAPGPDTSDGEAVDSMFP